MADTPARKAPSGTRLRVVRTERITPHMVRVVLSDDDGAFIGNGFTDQYVKLVFARPGHELLRDAPGYRAGESFVEAVRALTFRPGRVQVFVHGELGAMRDLRRHFLDDRAVPAELLSLSGYWRRGKDEDGFQAEKAEEPRLAREKAPAASS